MMPKILGIIVIIVGFGISTLISDFWVGLLIGLISAVIGGFLILKG